MRPMKVELNAGPGCSTLPGERRDTYPIIFGKILLRLVVIGPMLVAGKCGYPKGKVSDTLPVGKKLVQGNLEDLRRAGLWVYSGIAAIVIE